MADDYQDLVELGFEGIDKFADKYHDAAYRLAGKVGKHKPKWPRRGGKQPQDVAPPPTASPPPGAAPPPPQHRSRSVLPDDRYNDSDSESDRKNWEDRNMYGTYAPDRRRNSGWRDDPGYERTVENTQYYGYAPRASQQVVVRDRDMYRYPGAVTVRAPSPPPFGYAAQYEDAWATRGRPMLARRRSSSWSPPRRSDQRRYASPPCRKHSKSPNHHRAVATLVGALVGGVAGSKLKKGEPVPNTVSTVAGAVIGGIGAREIEKHYDRYKGRKAEEEDEHEERREWRRERERRYSQLSCTAKLR